MSEEPEVKAKRRHIEDALQIAINSTLKVTFAAEELIIQHSPNGGRRDKREAAKLKAMGVMAGWPDFEFHWPERVEHGGVMVKTGRMDSGFIEIKIPANKLLGITAGTLSDNQIIVRDRILAMGGKWALARSYEEVRDQLVAWGVRCREAY